MCTKHINKHIRNLPLKVPALFFSIKGHPSWSLISINGRKNMSSFEIKTLLLQEFLKNGIFFVNLNQIDFHHIQNILKVILPSKRNIIMIGLKKIRPTKMYQLSG